MRLRCVGVLHSFFAKQNLHNCVQLRNPSSLSSKKGGGNFRDHLLLI